MLQIHIASIAQTGRDLDEQVGASRLPLLVDLCRDGSVDFIRPVHVRIRASLAGESILIDGQVQTAVRMTCSRCLTPFESSIEADFSATAVAESQVGNDDGSTDEIELSANEMDIITYVGESIDLSEEIAQQIIMALPYKPLCRETCKGLCSHCGVDLNRNTCQCNAQDQGSPFAVLKTLTFPPRNKE